MDHKIEPMSVADFEDVTCLWREAEGVGLSESDDRSGIEMFLQRNPGLSLVARNETGEIIGAVLCGHDGRRGCLYHLAIARGHRRKGIGKSLVESCLARLRSL